MDALSDPSLHSLHEETYGPFTTHSVQSEDRPDAQADPSRHWAHVILLVLSCCG